MFVPDSYNNRSVVVQKLSRIDRKPTEFLRDEHKSHRDFTGSCHFINTFAKLHSFDIDGGLDVEELCKSPGSSQWVGRDDY